MNPLPEEDLQRRLQQLEAEINSFSPISTPGETQKQTQPSGFGKLNQYLERSQIWFQGLSGMNKLAVAGVAIFVGLLILQTVFKLVASVISLALLALLVYVGYKFFVSNSFQRKQ
ncbi:hypothetical protein A0J48_002090 [Sphaerospermopsis aphanizomenoides BCCUSP55]|uniref:hypothetical protein n=1 Tax=Sphaerospermopsis aphanizomenoides TaxID=459663 RepID=UPI001904CA93|nr:hypothetical protein [Sphaerospermopsis aphanizomenoides]MBK1986351.1 hypothetical protein [Sphaerospermopsis aphanizomenoides BCCUSP55]